MRRYLARAGLIGGLTVALLAGVQGQATASSWHVQGAYDSGTSCTYAGYYGWRYGNWIDYYCSKEPVNRVWWLMVYY